MPKKNEAIAVKGNGPDMMTVEGKPLHCGQTVYVVSTNHYRGPALPLTGKVVSMDLGSSRSVRIQLNGGGELTYFAEAARKPSYAGDYNVFCTILAARAESLKAFKADLDEKMKEELKRSKDTSEAKALYAAAAKWNG